MKLGLETFSYHLALDSGRMSIFDFIDRTVDLGLDGVEINIGTVEPDKRHLGGDSPDYLKEVRKAIESNNLFAEVDTRGTDPEYLRGVLELCNALGAKVLRTYQPPRGDTRRDMETAVINLKEIVPVCADLGVHIAFENHEYETSSDIIGVIRQVESEWIGALVDNGNSMMVWEDPVTAVSALAPYAAGSHFKDHVVIIENGVPMICGVTLGTGSIDCESCFRILTEESELDHINIEVCYEYRAPFRRAGTGNPAEFAGAFRAFDPPFDETWIPASSVMRSSAELDRLIEFEDRSVVESVAYVKSIRDAVTI